MDASLDILLAKSLAPGQLFRFSACASDVLNIRNIYLSLLPDSLWNTWAVICNCSHFGEISLTVLVKECYGLGNKLSFLKDGFTSDLIGLGLWRLSLLCSRVLPKGNY